MKGIQGLLRANKVLGCSMGSLFGPVEVLLRPQKGRIKVGGQIEFGPGSDLRSSRG